MQVRINFNADNPFFDTSKDVVKKFVEEEKSQLNKNEIRSRINLLTEKLRTIHKNSAEYQGKKLVDMVIPIDAFPEEMKKWAFAKKALGLEVPEIEEIERVTPQRKVDKAERLEYTFANRDWSDVEVVQLAKRGQRGAWFYVNAQRGSVVVKSQEGVEKQLMGCTFLRGMSINSPDSKIVARHSAEGEQLSNLGEKEGLNNNNPTHYIIMNRVKGVNYSDLSSSEDHIQLVVDNLEILGELAVYDLVLGNFDRFQLDSMSFNAGNIMFENGTVCPIDTDCIPIEEDRLLFTRFALKRIVEGKGDYDDKMSRKLATNLNGGVEPELFSKDKIKEGMNKAIVKLIKFTENMDLQKRRFMESCRERGGELSDFPSHLEHLLLHIKECYKLFKSKK